MDKDEFIANLKLAGFELYSPEHFNTLHRQKLGGGISRRAVNIFGGYTVTEGFMQDKWVLQLPAFRGGAVILVSMHDDVIDYPYRIVYAADLLCGQTMLYYYTAIPVINVQIGPTTIPGRMEAREPEQVLSYIRILLHLVDLYGGTT